MRRLLLTLLTLSWLVCGVLFGGAVPVANAETIIIGTNSGDGAVNRFPFGVDDTLTPNYQAGATYQQFYARDSFTTPVTITQLAFASSRFPATSPGTAAYDLSVSLGTVTPQLAPFANFNANRGRAADFTTVFSGLLAATLTRLDMFDLQINLAAPFTYNPGAGDLMLDVVINSATTFTGSRLYFVASVGPELSVVVNAAPSAIGRVEVGYGLQTRLTFTTEPATPIPEPATMILLGSGLVGVVAQVRHRRAAKMRD